MTRSYRIRWTVALLATLLVAIPGFCATGSTRMVVDLTPGADEIELWPTVLTSLEDGRVLFWSRIQPELGRELYITDGTAAGTQLVVDAFPGAEEGFPHLDYVRHAGRFVVFVSRLGGGYLGQWITDGTPAGTFLVAPPAGVEDFCFLGAIPLPRSERFMFFVDGADIGCEPAIFDPATESWTVFDFFPGPLTSDLTWLTADGEPSVVVGVRTANEGEELLLFDGLDAAGAVEATPLKLAQGNGTVRFKSWFKVSRGTVFLGPDPSNPVGSRVWRSDGTVAGTQPMRAIPGVVFLAVAGATGERAVLTTLDHDKSQLWATNGTERSLRRISRFVGERSLRAGTGLPFSTPGLVGFLADDGIHGTELWQTDGTPRGTRMAADLCEGSCSSQASFLGVAKAHAFLLVKTPDTGTELWGVAAGDAAPRQLVDACPGTCSPYVVWHGPGVHGAYLSFVDLSGPADAKDPLWISDGTPGGTRPLGAWSAAWADVTPVGTHDVFGATRLSDGTGGVARTDGTALGTAFLDLPAAREARSTYPHLVGEAGGFGYFEVRHESGAELWVTDGTEGGTRRFPSDLPGWIDGPTTPWGNGLLIVTSFPQALIAVRGPDEPTIELSRCVDRPPLVNGGRIWFTCGGALWSSEGSVETTKASGYSASFRAGLLPFGASGVLFFAGTNWDLQAFATGGLVEEITEFGEPFEGSVTAAVSSAGRPFVRVLRSGGSVLLSQDSLGWRETELPDSRGGAAPTLFPHLRGVGLAYRSGEYWSSDGSPQGLLRHTNWTANPGSSSDPIVARLGTGYLFSNGWLQTVIDDLTQRRIELDSFDGGHVDLYQAPRVVNGQGFFVVNFDDRREQGVFRTTPGASGVEELTRSKGLRSILPLSNGKVLYENWTVESGDELWIWEH